MGNQENAVYQYCKYCTDEVDEDSNSNRDIPLTKVMQYKKRKSILDIRYRGKDTFTMVRWAIYVCVLLVSAGQTTIGFKAYVLHQISESGVRFLEGELLFLSPLV